MQNTQVYFHLTRRELVQLMTLADLEPVFGSPSDMQKRYGLD